MYAYQTFKWPEENDAIERSSLLFTSSIPSHIGVQNLYFRLSNSYYFT